MPSATVLVSDRRAHQPSISLRGNRLAYARGSYDLNIWRVQATTTGQNAEPAMFISSTRRRTAAQYSPDGKRIAFSSDRSGNDEIWVTDSDGSHPVQITAFGKEVGTPRWSPDGKRIAFDSNAETQFFQVYTISADGGKPKRLTDGAFENAIPSWSRDGKWIYFESQRTGRPEIWKVSPTEVNHARSRRTEAIQPLNRPTESGCISRHPTTIPRPLIGCPQKVAPQ